MTESISKEVLSMRHSTAKDQISYAVKKRVDRHLHEVMRIKSCINVCLQKITDYDAGISTDDLAAVADELCALKVSLTDEQKKLNAIYKAADMLKSYVHDDVFANMQNNMKEGEADQ